MLRFLLLSVLATVVIRAVWRLLIGIAEGASTKPRRTRPPERGVAMVRDPVCGTFVVPSPALVLRQGNQELYFCSEECRRRYQSR